MTQPPRFTGTTGANSPGIPVDLKQRKDLSEYLQGVHGMSQQRAEQVMKGMTAAERTRCEMDMANRRRRTTFQSAYDPYKQPYEGKFR